ncbi:uncharacterized protein LOC108992227 [Juglans regia]|uniref:Uncharacterized protein LOC108992227 n=1 Tax=Juglans regia TaxID=51240 RepID=A0A6P9E6M2_JUGRE|nr:uncharacterized protein LOC108992227 [Juglans regia]
MVRRTSPTLPFVLLLLCSSSSSCLPKPFGNGAARILPSLLPFLLSSSFFFFFFFRTNPVPSPIFSSSSFFFLLLLLLVVVVEPCATIHPPSRGPSASPHPFSHGLRFMGCAAISISRNSPTLARTVSLTSLFVFDSHS